MAALQNRVQATMAARPNLSEDAFVAAGQVSHGRTDRAPPPEKLPPTAPGYFDRDAAQRIISQAREEIARLNRLAENLTKVVADHREKEEGRPAPVKQTFGMFGGGFGKAGAGANSDSESEKASEGGESVRSEEEQIREVTQQYADAASEPDNDDNAEFSTDEEIEKTVAAHAAGTLEEIERPVTKSNVYCTVNFRERTALPIQPEERPHRKRHARSIFHDQALAMITAITRARPSCLVVDVLGDMASNLLEQLVKAAASLIRENGGLAQQPVAGLETAYQAIALVFSASLRELGAPTQQIISPDSVIELVDTKSLPVHVDTGAATAFAAATQSVVSYVLAVAHQVQVAQRADTLVTRHIKLGISLDRELSALFGQAIIPYSGVLPYVDTFYTSEHVEKKVARHRDPATVRRRRQAMLADISRQQASSTPLATHPLMVKRLVHEITQDYKTDVDWTNAAMEAIHVALEDYLTNMFRVCTSLAVRSGRDIIEPKDIQLARRLLAERC